jgi:putative flippase GtrA
MLGQLLRFLGVGGIATLVHISAAVLAHSHFPVSDQQANLIGFGAALGVSYLGHAFFTFGTGLIGWAGLIRFLVVAMTGLLVSTTIVWLVTDRLDFGFALAMVAVGLAVPIASFVALRIWVFADRPGR